MLFRIITFLIINFGALAIGSFFTGKGVSSDWYQSLDKAPWSPPGWVFGAAWFTVMACFTIYMAIAWKQVENQKLLVGLYILQLMMNISWNPVFFYLRSPGFALAIITGLTILMTVFLLKYWPTLNLVSLLVLPYTVWLIIATSLNGYIVFKN